MIRGSYALPARVRSACSGQGSGVFGGSAVSEKLGSDGGGTCGTAGEPRGKGGRAIDPSFAGSRVSGVWSGRRFLRDRVTLDRRPGPGAPPRLRACVTGSVLGLLATMAMGAMGCPGGPSEDDIRRSRAAYELGVGLYNEQNLAGAFQHLREAVRLDPENVEAHAVLGTLHMLRQEFELAERHLTTAIETNERLGAAGLPALTPDVYNTLGVLYIHARRYEDAIAALRRSTGDLMNRTPHLAWGNLGWAYYEVRDYAQATEALQQAVRLQPQFCNGWFRLGQVDFALGRQADESSGPGAGAEAYARAEAALTHALEVDRDECRALQEAWLLRGETRARLGRREEAISDFERCVELSASTEAGRACAGFLSSGA